MKFLIISVEGGSLGMAMKLKAEGNTVAWWKKEQGAVAVGDNLVQDITDWKFKPDDETVWVFDCTGLGHFADALRAAGHPVFGGSLLADQIEEDRDLATKMFKEAGIEVPYSKTFDDWKAAKEYVQTSKKRLAFKPCKELSGVLPSYVSKNTEDMLGMLSHYQHTHPAQPVFMLQDYFKGTDFSSEGWFDGEEFIMPCNRTLETKHVMDGDRGPSGGCAGNIVYGCDDFLMKETVYKMAPVLRRMGYQGPFDVNAIYDGHAVKAIEPTPRLGMDAWPTLSYMLIEGELGKFISDFAHGQLYEFPLKSGFGGGVRMTLSPYPDPEGSGPIGLPVMGLTDKDLVTDFWPYDLMRNDEGALVTAGNGGLIGVALAHDEDPMKAMTKATERAKKVHVPDAEYRLDLASVFEKDLEDLGFLKGESKPEAEPVARPAEKRMNRLFPKRS